VLIANALQLEAAWRHASPFPLQLRRYVKFEVTEPIYCRSVFAVDTLPYAVTLTLDLWPWTFAVYRLWRDETLYQLFSCINLYDNVYCTRGHNFRLIKQHRTVNCYSNSFVGRTVNAWNALAASAFDCDSVSGFECFVVDCDLSQFLWQ